MSRTVQGEPSIRVTIESIAAGGEGVGRLPDGRAVFVHGVAPGEEVEVEIVRSRPRWARARLQRILQSSPERRTPPCPFQGRCGGCTLEHLEYPAQLAAKSRIVVDALTRIGGLEVEPPEVTPSPKTERYRNRVSFTLRRLSGSRVVAGFHQLGSPERIVDVDGGCLLPEEPISRTWDELRSAWGEGGRRLPGGGELRLTLRATAAGDVSLLIEGGGPGEGLPDELIAAVPALRAIWHAPGNEAPRLLAGEATLTERWGEEEIPLAARAFLQVNRDAAALLEAHLLHLAGEVHGQRVVDAYCGVGLHARRLARAGARVVGLELDSDAVAAARAADVPGTEFLEGTVEALLPEVLPADVVILNPPRGGVAAEALDALLATPPARVLYISCDPATLARDLKRLAGHFAVTSLRSFDLFPQTAHVETVVELTRQSGGGG